MTVARAPTRFDNGQNCEVDPGSATQGGFRSLATAPNVCIASTLIVGLCLHWMVQARVYSYLQLRRHGERADVALCSFCLTTSAQAGIVSVSEPTTCKYEIDVIHPSLCNNPAFPRLSTQQASNQQQRQMEKSSREEWCLLPYERSIEGAVSHWCI